MEDETGGVDRRTLLAGGVLSAIALGAAACTSEPRATDPAAPTRAGAEASRTTSAAASGATTPPTPAHPPGHATGTLTTHGPDIRMGPSTRQRVALTFHGAGDPALTRHALSVFGTRGAHVTVFAVGQWLAANPDLGRVIVAGGHDLGNHTWSHQTMPRLGASAARTEVARGAAAVAAIPGSSPLLFRPSGTPASTPLIREAAAASGYARCISYDVDPADYQDPGTALVVRRTLAGVRAGSIVSLHLGHAGTVAALPEILHGLEQRSLRAVTMTELLS